MTFKTQHQAADDQYIDIFSAPIVATGTRTASVDLDGRAPIRLLMPAGWATTAAIVHFDISDDGTTYYRLWSAGTAYTVTTVKSKASPVDPEKFWGCKYLRLVGTRARGTAEAQTTACVVGIVARLI